MEKEEDNKMNERIYRSEKSLLSVTGRPRGLVEEVAMHWSGASSSRWKEVNLQSEWHSGVA